MSAQLCLGLPNGLFQSTYPAHLILLDFDRLNSIWWGVQILKFLVMQFSDLPFASSSLSGPNTNLNSPFLNTLSLCSSLNVRDQVSKVVMLCPVLSVLLFCLSINMRVPLFFSFPSTVVTWKSAKVYLLEHKTDVHIVYRITSFHMILDLMFQENRRPSITNLSIISNLSWRWIHVQVIRNLK